MDLCVSAYVRVAGNKQVNVGIYASNVIKKFVFFLITKGVCLTIIE